MSDSIVASRLEKGGHYYATVVNASSPEMVAEAYRAFARWARDDRLNFSYHDMAKMGSEIKKAMEADSNVLPRRDV